MKPGTSFPKNLREWLKGLSKEDKERETEIARVNLAKIEKVTGGK